jgi:hypothetical protein
VQEDGVGASPGKGAAEAAESPMEDEEENKHEERHQEESGVDDEAVDVSQGMVLSGLEEQEEMVVSQEF